jgi:hypothetical protein
MVGGGLQPVTRRLQQELGGQLPAGSGEDGGVVVYSGRRRSLQQAGAAGSSQLDRYKQFDFPRLRLGFARVV